MAKHTQQQPVDQQPAEPLPAGIPTVLSTREPDAARSAAWSPVPAVAIGYVGDRPTVTVTGQVGRATVTEVAGTVRGLVAVGARDVTVDLSPCWDGAELLAVLALARATLAERGGTLHLVGVALPEFLAALRAAPLDEVFLVYDAVRAISVPPACRGHTDPPGTPRQRPAARPAKRPPARTPRDACADSTVAL